MTKSSEGELLRALIEKQGQVPTFAEIEKIDPVYDSRENIRIAVFRLKKTAPGKIVPVWSVGYRWLAPEHPHGP